MTESRGTQPADGGDLSRTPAGAASQGEDADLHGQAREVQEAGQEGGAEGAEKTPGA
jgi:hypothetical protein